VTVTGQVTLSETAVMTVETGAEDLLAAAVHEHSRFVFKVAYSVLRNHHDAEDATQETFLRVVKHEREFLRVEDRRAWLARIVWRIAVDKRRRTPHASLDDEANQVLLAQVQVMETGAEQLLITDQMLRMLQSLMIGLPSDLRDVITLSTVDEMTSAQIAAVLGIPDISVRTRQFRARQMLKEKFATLLARTKEGAV
jgi:RNA polymerase sigma-70 factor (ECF subfamily)